MTNRRKHSAHQHRKNTNITDTHLCHSEKKSNFYMSHRDFKSLKSYVITFLVAGLFSRWVRVRRKYRCSFLLMFILTILLFCVGLTPGYAQIGGKTADDGIFVLDDAEDLDLLADGVMRNWIPDYVWPLGDVLTTLPLAGTDLTLAEDQTPIGALKATIPETHLLYDGYISAGFGVPMPAVAGESTLDYPGNITSFGTLSFYACFEPVLTGQYFQVVLETYSNTDYANIYWSYTPESGKTFQKVEIDLWNPDLIEGAGTLSLHELLSQTRFLYFYFYAGPVPIGSTLEFHIDDIELLGRTCTRHWESYR